jgi:phosphoribosylglycinamide formyltransferase-1
MRVAVLLSGSGSNLQALLDARRQGLLEVEVAAVLTERPDAFGLQRALQAGLPAVCLPLEQARLPAARLAWEERLATATALFEPDLVLLSGFMRVLSPAFLERFPHQVINQHPALLPDGGDTFITAGGLCIPALRGAHVVADALRLGLPVTGCTVHWVTPAVDDGPVLARAEVPILAGDDVEALHERIKQAERPLIVAVLKQLAAARGRHKG